MRNLFAILVGLAMPVLALAQTITYEGLVSAPIDVVCQCSPAPASILWTSLDDGLILIDPTKLKNPAECICLAPAAGTYRLQCTCLCGTVLSQTIYEIQVYSTARPKKVYGAKVIVESSPLPPTPVPVETPKPTVTLVPTETVWPSQYYQSVQGSCAGGSCSSGVYYFRR